MIKSIDGRRGYSDIVYYDDYANRESISFDILPDVGDTVTIQPLSWWKANPELNVIPDRYIDVIAGHQFSISHILYEWGDELNLGFHLNNTDPRYQISQIIFALNMFSDWTTTHRNILMNMPKDLKMKPDGTVWMPYTPVVKTVGNVNSEIVLKNRYAIADVPMTNYTTFNLNE